MVRWLIAHRHISRDTILFVVGLAGIIYETVVGGAEKPTLIIAFVGMVGTPIFLRTDERRARADSEILDPPKPTSKPGSTP